MIAVHRYKNLKIFFRKGTVDENVLAHSFEHDIFFPELSDLIRTPEMTIVDVGAHIGTFSVQAHLVLDRPRVFAVEPHQDTYSVLLRNLEANSLTNIVPINAAVTDANGPVKLFLAKENWEHSITQSFDSGCLEVPGITLETLLKRFHIDQCDLLKLNCEGAEFRIVMSMSPEALSRIKMMLILFHEDLVEPEYDRSKLINFLQVHGFNIRTSQMRKDRGWIVAKNRLFYPQKLNTSIRNIKSPINLKTIKKKLRKRLPKF